MESAETTAVKAAILGVGKWTMNDVDDYAALLYDDAYTSLDLLAHPVLDSLTLGYTRDWAQRADTAVRREQNVSTCCVHLKLQTLPIVRSWRPRNHPEAQNCQHERSTSVSAPCFPSRRALDNTQALSS